jgi:hypothetical protein
VRAALSSYIRTMASRPCKPDADLKRLWRMLLPNTPFPACGAPENFNSAADRPENGSDDAEPNAADTGVRQSRAAIRPWRFF